MIQNIREFLLGFTFSATLAAALSIVYILTL